MGDGVFFTIIIFSFISCSVSFEDRGSALGEMLLSKPFVLSIPLVEEVC